MKTKVEFNTKEVETKLHYYEVMQYEAGSFFTDEDGYLYIIFEDWRAGHNGDKFLVIMRDMSIYSRWDDDSYEVERFTYLPKVTISF